MSDITHDDISKVHDLVFSSMDAAVVAISRRLDAEGGDMDMLATALMGWALSRHAAIYACASKGNTRIRDGMIVLLKEMIDKQYEGEFNDVAARHAGGDATEATLQ